LSGDPAIAVASEELVLELGIANRARRASASLHRFVAETSLEGHDVEVQHFGRITIDPGIGRRLRSALARADGDGGLHGGTRTSGSASGSCGSRDSAARNVRLDGGRVASAIGPNADGSFG